MSIKKLLAKVGAALSYLTLTSPVLAQMDNIAIGKPSEVKITEFSPLIQGVIRIAFVVAIILTFLFLLWGGLQWIMSGGDKAKYEEARNRITAALIGLVIVALAWLLIKLVTHFLGLPDLFGSDTFTIPKAYQE
jgi:hypothetical protein